jgi:hypothetical protein
MSTTIPSCVVCDDLGCEHCPKVRLPRADYALRDEGTLVLLWTITPEATAWVDEYLPDDRLTWGHATIVESRYIGDILDGMAADGLVGRAA